MSSDPTVPSTSIPFIAPPGMQEAEAQASIIPVRRQNKPVVLSARSIRKTYTTGDQTHVVLDEVDLEIVQGERVFLSGPSGCGKSTLLSILGCLLDCDSGTVSIAGERVDNLAPAAQTQVRRNEIGFVFQRFQLIQALNAEDNVALPLTLQNIALPEARARASEILSRVGLETRRQHLPRAMSPGQCQRVALARAIVTKPKLILADEPTAALDADSGTEVMTLLQELVAETAAATVIVTHDPRILKYADRVCEMHNGRIKK